jgi:hypothetical protein
MAFRLADLSAVPISRRPGPNLRPLRGILGIACRLDCPHRTARDGRSRTSQDVCETEEGPPMSTLQRLTDRGLIKPPRWLPGNAQYETIMGSVAYGVSSDTSDVDVYGWAIPLKEDIFPHLRGEVPGFGRQARRFEQYQEHHVQDQDALAGHGRSYDLTIFGIVKFFPLFSMR